MGIQSQCEHANNTIEMKLAIASSVYIAVGANERISEIYKETETHIRFLCA